MTRKLSIALVVMAALVITVGSTLAANAHFIGTPQLTQTNNSIVITASVAGLGNVPDATFNLSGTVDVNSRCYTRKGNTPQAANKQESISVNSTDTFAVRNGRTDISFSVAPLSTLTCPGGQHVVIESVTYDLTLSGQGVSYNFSS
jgi:hypothetical protein